MSNKTRRKVAWCLIERRHYVIRDSARYWAPRTTVVRHGLGVEVINPTAQSVTVKAAGVRETWTVIPPSPADGG